LFGSLEALKTDRMKLMCLNHYVSENFILAVIIITQINGIIFLCEVLWVVDTDELFNFGKLCRPVGAPEAVKLGSIEANLALRINEVEGAAHKHAGRLELRYQVLPILCRRHLLTMPSRPEELWSSLRPV
jgi:hypothetical protein